MKLTRDSMIVTVSLIASIVGFLTGNVALLTQAFPWVGPRTLAILTLISGITGIVAGVLRMSPLSLSASNELATRDHDQTLNPITSKPKE